MVCWEIIIQGKVNLIRPRDQMEQRSKGGAAGHDTDKLWAQLEDLATLKPLAVIGAICLEQSRN